MQKGPAIDTDLCSVYACDELETDKTPLHLGVGVPSMVVWVTGPSPLATSVTSEDCQCTRDPPLHDADL